MSRTVVETGAALLTCEHPTRPFEFYEFRIDCYGEAVARKLRHGQRRCPVCGLWSLFDLCAAPECASKHWVPAQGLDAPSRFSPRSAVETAGELNR